MAKGIGWSILAPPRDISLDCSPLPVSCCLTVGPVQPDKNRHGLAKPL